MKPTFIYMTRNGLLEPLGQSQIMGYLRGLSRDYRIIVFSREKSEDWADERIRAAVAVECQDLGIDWRPRHFRASPRFVAPILDLFTSYKELRQIVEREHPVGIHARSYLPAEVARRVSRQTGIPFIFDMRALWPEELIAAGRITKGGMVHRALSQIERACLRDAAIVVSLTNAAVGYLRAQYPVEVGASEIVVIPTCADLDRFQLPSVGVGQKTVTSHGCIGTVLSGWFKTDWLRSWFCELAETDSRAQFEIVTKDDPDAVRQAIDPQGHLGNRLQIGSSASQGMPVVVRSHADSAMFFSIGLSKLGSCPTRLGEVLGSGLPVVVNEGVGDVAEIVRDNQVGVIAKSAEQGDMRQAVIDLIALKRDPDLAKRCRVTAEAFFSLEKGTERYRKIYRKLEAQAS